MDQCGLERKPLGTASEGAFEGSVVGVEAFHVVVQRVHAGKRLVAQVARHLGSVWIVHLLCTTVWQERHTSVNNSIGVPFRL